MTPPTTPDGNAVTIYRNGQRIADDALDAAQRVARTQAVAEFYATGDAMPLYQTGQLSEARWRRWG